MPAIQSHTARTELHLNLSNLNGSVIQYILEMDYVYSIILKSSNTFSKLKWSQVVQVHLWPDLQKLLEMLLAKDQKELLVGKVVRRDFFLITKDFFALRI